LADESKIKEEYQKKYDEEKRIMQEKLQEIEY
jgi:hypothetical protein